MVCNMYDRNFGKIMHSQQLQNELCFCLAKKPTLNGAAAFLTPPSPLQNLIDMDDLYYHCF